MNLKLTRAQLVAVARRVGSAFLVAFVASAVSSGVLSMAHVTDLSLWEKAGFSGVAAVLALVQSVASQWITGAPTLTALLRMVTRSGRADAVARKAELRLPAVRALPVGRFTGKQPAAPIEHCARLDTRMAATRLPKPHGEFSWVAKLVIAWGMMLNDRLGDCTCAAVGHAIQLWTAIASRLVTLSDGTILALYEAVSGYDPQTGANDNGAVEANVLARWRVKGVAGHKIAAYGRIDPDNLTAVKQAIQLFGLVYIGTMVPRAWEAAPAVWGVPRGKAADDIVGGHAVILVGWDHEAFLLVSWGQVYRMTYAAFDRYVDEVWGVVSTDWLEQDRQAPSGVDIDGLLADLDQLEAAA